MIPYLILYLIIINAAAAGLMLYDKLAAKKSAWRIPEAFLMRIAVLGGCFGIFLGMHLFRHKTKHTLFTTGVPLIMLVYWLLAVLAVFLIK